MAYLRRLARSDAELSVRIGDLKATVAWLCQGLAWGTTGVGWLVPVDEDEQGLDDGLEEVDGEDVYRLGSFVLSSDTFCG